MKAESAQHLPRDGAIDLTSIEPGTRSRLSGPGLRTFRSIGDRWGLSESQRRTLLGGISRSTYYQWIKNAEEDEKVTLTLDTLLRISAVLGVHKALGILFVRESEGLAWLKGPHAGPLFGGQSPMEMMLSGTQDGILQVRRYLDAWRGGLRGAPDAASGVPAVTRDDLVFV